MEKTLKWIYWKKEDEEERKNNILNLEILYLNRQYRIKGRKMKGKA